MVNNNIVMIGVSTGGPIALRRLFAELPPLDAAIVIVLHIPPGMDYKIAMGLDAVASMPVALAEDGEYLRSGRVYLAPGGFHLKLEGNSRIILEEGARVNFVLTCAADDARAVLGPLAEEFLVFCDPDRIFVRSLGLATLPAFVFVRIDGTVPAAAEGWNPAEWKAVAEVIAEATAWTAPTIPAPGDPGPFHGTPALG